MTRLRPLQLYKKLLRSGQRFFDPVGSWYVQWRTRAMFRRYRHERDTRRIAKHVKEGMTMLRRVRRAVKGSTPDAQRVIDLAYGVTGRVKHEIARFRHLMLTRTDRIDPMHELPPLVRLMFLSDADTFRDALRERIQPLPRAQRHLFATILGRKAFTHHQEPDHYKTSLG
ncbi:LYR motif-containing protein Cup1-like N-terminal domain-containing protein [Plasmodiophora brassicae]|uniref:LYR motif-containing protein Cup1-like N-terminal domain-containing protein n=1 Tax=Plasmodiophora brassicae TaxID=37360 RepID=A0A0G4IS78_PLABS|nr:hypothetical protein PBRA_006176 [Plasmodiophora brassicae]SPQ96118.1 unnamed protein product [Plasmodiophora brassicae]